MHMLTWQGLYMSLGFVQPHINPADLMSRACDGRGLRQAVLEAIACQQVFDAMVKLPPWGALGDKDKSGRAWMGDVCIWRMCCCMPCT